jgi:spore germination protein KB
MIKEKKIGTTEAIALLVTCVSTKIYLTTPAIYVNLGGNAAWMMIIISDLATLAFFRFIVKHAEYFPDKTFPETAENVAGFLIGGILSLLLWAFFLVETGLSARKFSEMVVLVALPETSIGVIILVFLASSSVVTYLGLSTVAGAAYLSFPFVVIAIFSICVLSYNLWNISWLFPLFTKGIDQTLLVGILRSSDFIEILPLYVFVDMFYPKQIKRIGYKSISFSTLVLFLIMLTYSLSFPEGVSQEKYLPLYTMARNIYLGRFIQRIEAIFVLFWVLSGCLWISVGFFACSKLLSDLLKLPDYRPLIPAMGVLLYTTAVLPQSMAEVIKYSDIYIRSYSFILVFGLPALLLLIAVLRGKVGKSHAKK